MNTKDKINNTLIENTQKRISTIIEQIYSLNIDIILMTREPGLKNLTSLDLKSATYDLGVLLYDLEREKKAD